MKRNSALYVRQGYLRDARKRNGLPQEILAELKAYDQWVPVHGNRVGRYDKGPRKGEPYCQFENAGDGIGQIGPACSYFEQWVQNEGMHWLEAVAGPLEWVHRPIASRWQPGDFLRTHSDGPEDQKTWSINIFLTYPWEDDWGGHLFIQNPDRVDWGFDCVPSDFDRLAFSHGQDHFVSQIASYAKETRYAITGWLINREEDA